MESFEGINGIGLEFVAHSFYKHSPVNRCKVTFKVSGYTADCQIGDAKRGKVKDKFHPHLYGVGFMGNCNYKSTSKEYRYWSRMMARCYDKETQKRQPSYKNKTVCVEWHNLSNFVDWLVAQPGYNFGWDLDKDLLIEGNTEYNPHACCLLPKELNSKFPIKHKGHYYRDGKYEVSYGNLHIGRFSTETEAWKAYSKCVKDTLVRLAEKYKGVISTAVYNHLINYQIG